MTAGFEVGSQALHLFQVGSLVMTLTTTPNELNIRRTGKEPGFLKKIDRCYEVSDDVSLHRFIPILVERRR